LQGILFGVAGFHAAYNIVDGVLDQSSVAVLRISNNQELANQLLSR
jgi:hypothetical protein